MRFNIPQYGGLPTHGWWLLYGDAIVKGETRQFWVLKLPVWRYGEIDEPWNDQTRLGWQQMAITRHRSITGRNDAVWKTLWLERPQE